MSSQEKSIEVDVPVTVAYNQWTQFETFPSFMEGVKSVNQLDDQRLHWVAEIAGQEREWDATITEQIPDERIAWKGEGEASNAGVVTFHKLDEAKTKIMLQLEFAPEGFVEKAGDALGATGHRIEGDLERFKSFIEERGTETGAWRGEISNN
jgi:uncharacterized membrane protein